MVKKVDGRVCQMVLSERWLEGGGGGRRGERKIEIFQD